MADQLKTKSVKAGDWRTLEWGLNTTFDCQFNRPAGAQIKIRMGISFLGWDSQKQTLDGNPRALHFDSKLYGRIQIKVTQDTDVTYRYVPIGP